MLLVWPQRWYWGGTKASAKLYWKGFEILAWYWGGTKALAKLYWKGFEIMAFGEQNTVCWCWPWMSVCYKKKTVNWFRKWTIVCRERQLLGVISQFWVSTTRQPRECCEATWSVSCYEHAFENAFSSLRIHVAKSEDLSSGDQIKYYVFFCERMQMLLRNW